MIYSISERRNNLKNVANYNIRGYVAHALRILNHKLTSLGLMQVVDDDYITYETILRNYNMPLEHYFPQLIEWHIINDNVVRNTKFLEETRELARTCPLLRNDLPWKISYPTRLFLYRNFVLPSTMVKYIIAGLK